MAATIIENWEALESTWLINDSANVTSQTFTIWIDEHGDTSMQPRYSGGTKLLRDAAQVAEDYTRKNIQSRSGWKTRRELRDV